jgi:polyphosphate kinase
MPQRVRPVSSAAVTEPLVPADAACPISNRETSWVEFDRRVLDLAATPRLPLLHRVKLCGVVSSNLDEFFSVRVARMLKRRRHGVRAATPGGARAAQTLAAIRPQVVDLQAAQDALWHESLVPDLAERGIRILSRAGLDAVPPLELAALVRERLLPTLEPIAVAPGAPFPVLRALTLAILAETRSASSGRRGTVVVALPDAVPRFLPLAGRGGRIFVGVEDLVLGQLQTILGTAPIHHCVVRVTRDALVPSTLDAGRPDAESEIHGRRERRNAVVRLEVSADSPEPLVLELAERLGLDEDQVYQSSAPLGLAALRDSSMLKGGSRGPTAPSTPPAPVPQDIFTRLSTGDVLAHHPYDSFEESVDAFTAAARDPDVTGLEATVYRTGNPSGTLAKLMETARDGRRAVCVMELRARFDEAPNISWTRTLRRAGVEVLHGPPDVKVHAKLAVIERREAGETRRYVHIGTGNYHASNASVYEDLSLFTADPVIAADAQALFDTLAGSSGVPRFGKLVVGPWYLKRWLLREIDTVADGARSGHPSRITIKANAVADPDVVAALYAASTAGVRIEIVVRGICTLRPGVAGVSDRISVRSVLGPFLEHSRIFSFETGGHRCLMIGSADLLPRNLERRIEVLAPVEDPDLRTRIDGVRDALLADTAYAWELTADAGWRRLEPAPGAPCVSAHELLLSRARSAPQAPSGRPSGVSWGFGGAAPLGQEGERRHDAPVDIAGIGEPELREDRIDVALNAALGDVRCRRDRGIAATLGEEAEDLELSRRQHIELMSRPGRQDRRNDL